MQDSLKNPPLMRYKAQLIFRKGNCVQLDITQESHVEYLTFYVSHKYTFRLMIQTTYFLVKSRNLFLVRASLRTSTTNAFISSYLIYSLICVCNFKIS